MFPVPSRRRTRRALSISLATGAALACAGAATAAAQPQVVASGARQPARPDPCRARGRPVRLPRPAEAARAGPRRQAEEAARSASGPPARSPASTRPPGAKSPLAERPAVPGRADRRQPRADSSGPQDISFDGSAGFFRSAWAPLPRTGDARRRGRRARQGVPRRQARQREQGRRPGGLRGGRRPGQGAAGRQGRQLRPVLGSSTGRGLLAILNAGHRRAARDEGRQRARGHRAAVGPRSSRRCSGCRPARRSPCSQVSATGIIRGSHRSSTWLVGSSARLPVAGEARRTCSGWRATR